MKNNDNKLVAAAVFANAPEANIAMGMLRANGVPCILDGEMAKSVLGIQLSPMDGIRLMVYEKDLALATELLNFKGGA